MNLSAARCFLVIERLCICCVRDVQDISAPSSLFSVHLTIPYNIKFIFKYNLSEKRDLSHTWCSRTYPMLSTGGGGHHNCPWFHPSFISSNRGGHTFWTIIQLYNCALYTFWCVGKKMFFNSLDLKLSNYLTSLNTLASSR